MRVLTNLIQKSLFLSLFLIAFSNCSIAQKGNGNVIKEQRDVKGFNAIKIGGAFDVYLRQGDKEDVTIIADENIIDNIKTEVHGDQLKISTSGYNTEATELKAYITVTNLESIDLSGACNLKTKNTIVTSEMQLDLSGASDIDLQVKCNHLEVEASGASDATINGTANTADIDASGASSVKGQNLNCKKAQVESSGASSVKIAVTEELEADASGASSIHYKGSPKIIAKESTAADIKKLSD